jgi:hypothetical protein
LNKQVNTSFEAQAHVCARLSGPQSGGVHLGVNALDQIVRIDQSTDTTPCTQTVVTLSGPRHGEGRNRTGDTTIFS